GAIGVQEHVAQLAAIARVDQARRVDDREAVARGEPGTRLDETGVSLRNRDGQTGADERSLARSELDALARREIEPGVTRVRALRHDSIRVQPLDRKLDQRARRAGSERASATR